MRSPEAGRETCSHMGPVALSLSLPLYLTNLRRRAHSRARTEQSAGTILRPGKGDMDFKQTRFN